MANYARHRPHLYLSKEYQCPAILKSVRIPQEMFEGIAKRMNDGGYKTISEYIRALIKKDTEIIDG